MGTPMVLIFPARVVMKFFFFFPGDMGAATRAGGYLAVNCLFPFHPAVGIYIVYD